MEQSSRACEVLGHGWHATDPLYSMYNRTQKVAGGRVRPDRGMRCITHIHSLQEQHHGVWNEAARDSEVLIIVDPETGLQSVITGLDLRTAVQTQLKAGRQPKRS